MEICPKGEFSPTVGQHLKERWMQAKWCTREHTGRKEHCCRKQWSTQAKTVLWGFSHSHAVTHLDSPCVACVVVLTRVAKSCCDTQLKSLLICCYVPGQPLCCVACTMMLTCATK
mmetsp:Transcript_17945/g.46980  ORF Transcript_17945/g.46980 Transcript_17945/m.46980 type:complete len:115 (-) Transcript_17945:81-425(-)|eukprot:1161750-Pelagomonas_calceolata.AAC.3